MEREEKFLFHPVKTSTLLFHRWDLLKQFTLRGITERYKASVLGILWSVFHPLLMLVVYTFVFSTIFKGKADFAGGQQDVPFALFLLCGMAIFSIFTESVNVCCNAIVGHQNFVKKVVFPLEILPTSKVLSTTILGLVWFILLVLGMLVMVHKLYWSMLLIPLIIIPLLLFTLGCSFVAASISVYIRDFQFLIGVVLQLLFFLTPVFYSFDRFNRPDFDLAKWGWAVDILKLNPLAPMIEQTRVMFLLGDVSKVDFASIGILWVVCFLVFHLGMTFFQATKKGFADVL